MSPGCKHCYAETFAERFRGVRGHPYERGFDPRFVPEALEAPLHWKKPRRVFPSSRISPTKRSRRCSGFMAACPQHTFQLLTKRSKRLREWCAWVDTAPVPVVLWTAPPPHAIDVCTHHSNTMMQRNTSALLQWPLPNVWLGVSAEDQERADERVPDLLATPAAVRFVSYEPALGPIDFQQLRCGAEFDSEGADFYDALRGRSYWSNGDTGCNGPALSWIIVGGESGRGARPFDPEWARAVVRQCKAAGVACFVKQMGDHAFERAVYTDKGVIGGGVALRRKDGKTLAPKGGDPDEWPEDLRVRQYPGRLA